MNENKWVSIAQVLLEKQLYKDLDTEVRLIISYGEKEGKRMFEEYLEKEYSKYKENGKEDNNN